METEKQSEPQADRVLRLFRRAKTLRTPWETHWRECYEFALPHRSGGFAGSIDAGAKHTDKVFDGTALDAVDQLAASIMAQLTPPWAEWFNAQLALTVGETDGERLAPMIEEAAKDLHREFDLSNFGVEIHQCYLDLVVAGTASLQLTLAEDRASSVLRFTAAPLWSVYLLADEITGELNHTFRVFSWTLAAIRRRFPDAKVPKTWESAHADNPGHRFTVVEAEIPSAKDGFDHVVLGVSGGLDVLAGGADAAATVSAEAGLTVLSTGVRPTGYFINFRWLKAPGETYGRSPVMKALPDIKTANKVVELVLKNAAIAVTGIWQCEDDGVINPATVKLVPGAIMPKAMGSQGLRPLETPGRFDVSQLVLEQLRSRIRKALLVDQLGQTDQPRMTATEVLERAAEMARILGATYGRLQTEMMAPVVERAFVIAAENGGMTESLKPLMAAVQSITGGAIPDPRKSVLLKYLSPLARDQQLNDARNIQAWLESVNNGLGPEGGAAVDKPETARHLGRLLGVPSKLILSKEAVAENADADADAAVDGLATEEGIKAEAAQLANAPLAAPVEDSEFVQ